MAIPCFSFFFCLALLNLSLMWTYIATRSQKLKKGKANLGTKLLIMVISISVLFAALMVVAFGILGSNTVGAGIAIVFVIFVTGSYFVSLCTGRRVCRDTRV